MTLPVAQTSPTLEDRWREAVRRCSHSTFFHTPEWFSLLEQTYGSDLRNATRVLTLPNGEEAVLPLVEADHEGKGFFKSYLAGYHGVYGGFLSASPLPEGFTDDALLSLKDWSLKQALIFGNPYQQENEIAKLRPDLSVRKDFTQCIDLSGLRDETDLLQSYSKSVRKRVRQGEKEGYTVERASSPADVDEYARVYQDRIDRWGDKATSVYPRRLFDNIFRLGESAAIWLIKKDSRVVGGNISFYHKKTTIDWQHVCDGSLLKTGISHFFTHRLILDALKRGLKVYDFNPSGGHEGVVAFKESFGALKRPFVSRMLQNNPLYKSFCAFVRWIHHFLLSFSIFDAPVLEVLLLI
jgi:hypothetical protein